jgi:GNAT superfamily N-acetyltransferase
VLTTREDGYEIDTSRERLDLPRLADWLASDAYWARGRPAEVTAAAVARSVCYGLYAPDGAQVGIARAVTDLATFAWICDVYVSRDVRGRGLGTWLARTATDHLLGYGLRRVVLATADAHEVYAKAGFTPLTYPDRWMEVLRDPPPPPSHGPVPMDGEA